MKPDYNLLRNPINGQTCRQKWKKTKSKHFTTWCFTPVITVSATAKTHNLQYAMYKLTAMVFIDSSGDFRDFKRNDNFDTTRNLKDSNTNTQRHIKTLSSLHYQQQQFTAPSDQMSAFVSYGVSFNVSHATTSGAILQQGICSVTEYSDACNYNSQAHQAPSYKIHVLSQNTQMLAKLQQVTT